MSATLAVSFLFAAASFAATAPPNFFTVAPANLDFGNVVIGTNRTQILRISNQPFDGSSTLTIQVSSDNPRFQPQPAVFKLPLSSVISSTDIQVTFAPASTGRASAKISFAAFSPQLTAPLPIQTITVAASGAGIDTLITASTTSLDFGAALINTSARKTLTISSAAVDFAAVTVQVASDNPVFTASPGAFPLTISPNLPSVDVAVTFSPRFTAPVTGSLIFSVSANGTTLQTLLVTLRGSGGNLSAAPATLDFGEVSLNTAANLSTRLTTVPVTQPTTLILSASSDNPSFTPLLGSFAMSAGPNPGATSLQVTFNPNAIGAARGAITIAAITSAGVTLPPLIVAVTGAGSDVRVSPSSLDFGVHDAGTTSAAQVAVLSNLTGATISATAASDDPAFTVSPASFSVPSGGARNISVTFRPSAAGAVNGTISIRVARGERTQVFPVLVTGSGRVSAFTVSPGSLDFGAVTLRSTSAPQSVTISNPSAITLPLSVSVSDPGFQLSPGSLRLPPNGSATVAVTFTPSREGVTNATAVFTASAGSAAATQSIALTGQGASSVLSFSVIDGRNTRPVLSGQPVDFGGVDVGSSSSLRFLISNPGPVPAIVQSIGLVGNNFSSGQVSLPATLIPNGTIAFDIVFAPTALASTAGSLSINGQRFDLGGAGLAPRVSAIRVVGAPARAAASQTSNLQVQLDTAYPLPIDGQLTLRFTPDVVNLCNDPPILFENGSAVVSFTVAPGQTQASFAIGSRAARQAGIQFGNVAGRIDVIGRLTTAGVDITPDPAPASSTLVPRQAPRLTGVSIVNKSGSSFDVVITGDATSREVSQAAFRLIPSNIGALQTTQVNVPVSSGFGNFYGTPASCSDFGSAFRLTQSFRIQGDAGAIGQVAVKLTNGQGDSQEITAPF